MLDPADRYPDDCPTDRGQIERGGATARAAEISTNLLDLSRLGSGTDGPGGAGD